MSRTFVQAFVCVAIIALPFVRTLSGEDDTSRLLLELQRDPTPGRAQDLIRNGEAAVPALRVSLASRRTRAVVACALATSSVPALRDALESLVSSGDQVSAYWATRALGSIADPRSLPVLASRLAKEPRQYWELANRTRAGYRPVFHRVRRGKTETIYATPEIPNLRVACAAMESIGHLPGEEADAVLSRAIRSEQHLVRYGAVRGLQHRGPSSTDLLRRVAYTDPVLYVRRAAVKALLAISRADGSEGETARIVAASNVEKARDLGAELQQRVSAIAFVKTRNRSESNLGFRDSYFVPKTPWYASGENLYILSPVTRDGTLRNLTLLEEGGRVQGPEVSPDGKRLVVGMRRRAGEPFHLWEIEVDSGERRQLTHGAANDVDPCYMADGRVVFSSDRDGTLEFYHQERTRTIHVIDPRGGTPQQITFNPNQDYEPLALRDGRVLYSSYRFYGQDGSGGIYSDHPGSIARIETQLRTVLALGAGDNHLYGSHRGGFYVPVRELPDGDQFQAPSLLHGSDHIGVSISQARELSDGRLVCVTPSGLTVIETGLDPRDCEIPVHPEVLNLAGGEEVYIHNHDDMNPIGRYTSPYPIGDDLALVSHAPWYRLGGNAYGIWLLDLETGSKVLVYDDPQVSEVDAISLSPWSGRQRYTPGGKSDRATATGEVNRDHEKRKTGTIGILSVFDSDLQFDRERVRYVRVIAAERLAASMNANGGFRSRVLATVPVDPDGSVHLEVPADTAIHFNLLDENESVIVHETAFMYVRPGEHRTCIGCHEKGNAAPPNGRYPTALRKPPYRAIPTDGDLIYMGQTAKSYSVIHR